LRLWRCPNPHIGKDDGCHLRLGNVGGQFRHKLVGFDQPGIKLSLPAPGGNDLGQQVAGAVILPQGIAVTNHPNHRDGGRRGDAG
jgi:hypothetical protein